MRWTREHEDFGRRVRETCERELVPYVDVWERDRSYSSRDVFPVLGAAGLLGVEYDPQWGGKGLDHRYTIVLCEELGRTIGSSGVVNSITIQSEMATSSLARYGTDDLKRRYLAPAIRGEMVAAVGVSEPGGGSDVAGIRTRAERDGDHWVLNGVKKWITNGAQAHWVSVLARTSEEPGWRGLSQFVVPTDTPGFSARRLDKLGGRAVDSAELTLVDCSIPAGNLIGELGRGFHQQMGSFDRERMVAVYTAVGEMDRALERTRAYVQQRKAFGRPLIESQVVQFSLAGLAAELEMLRTYSYSFVQALEAGEDTRRIAAVAKLKAGRLIREVADTCVQFHGGTGYLDDEWVARFFRDGRQYSIGGGSDEIMLRILARMDGMPNVF